MQTRRHFLRDCSLGVLTATVAPVSGWAVHQASRQWAPVSALAGGFAALVNTPFAIRTQFGATRLVLEQVIPGPPTPPEAEDAGNERFSLFFRGPLQEPLEQDTYLFEHARMSNLAIFITRIGSLDPGNCYYEAVFNHPVSPQALATQRGRAPRPVSRD